MQDLFAQALFSPDQQCAGDLFAVGVGQRDLVDRLIEPRHVHAAEPVRLDLRCQDIVAQRKLEAIELGVLARRLVALENGFKGRNRVS